MINLQNNILRDVINTKEPILYVKDAEIKT
jgi:hypothetical protein